MNVAMQNVECKFCDSKNVIKYGNFKNIQRYWCKDCHRKFAGNSALPRMKIALQQVTSAVGSYFEGIPLNVISQEIEKKYCLCVSDSTIFEWISKLSYLGTEDTKNFHPRVSDTWIVHETSVKIDGVELKVIDIVDLHTLFIIASMTCRNFEMDCLNQLIKSAQERAGWIAKELFVLGSEECLEKINQYLNSSDNLKTNTRCKFITAAIGERIKSSFMVRNSLLSKLKKQENVKKILNGWLVHYNYRKSNEYLDNLTPAEKAGIRFASRSNLNNYPLV